MDISEILHTVVKRDLSENTDNLSLYIDVNDSSLLEAGFNCSSGAPVCYQDASQFTAYIAFMVPIGLVGVVLNAITLGVLCSKTFRSPVAAVLLLRALAVSDLMTCLIAFPIGFCRCIYTEEEFLVSLAIYYEAKLYLPIGNIFATSSLWLVVAVSAERCIGLVRPLKHKVYCTQGNAKKAILVIFLSALIINIPMFFTLEREGDHVVFTAWSKGTGYRVYSFLRMAMVKLIPVICLIIISVLSIHAISQFQANQDNLAGGDRRESNASAKRQQIKIRVSIMVVVISFISLISHLMEPFVHPQVYSSLFKLCPYTEFHMDLISYSNTLEVVSYSCNFVFYCLFNRQFVRALRKMFHCKTQVDASLTPAEYSPPDARNPENRTADTKITDSKTVETRTVEAKTIDTSLADTKTTDTKRIATMVVANKSSCIESPGSKASVNITARSMKTDTRKTDEILIEDLTCGPVEDETITSDPETAFSVSDDAKTAGVLIKVTELEHSNDIIGDLSTETRNADDENNVEVEGSADVEAIVEAEGTADTSSCLTPTDATTSVLLHNCNVIIDIEHL